MDTCSLNNSIEGNFNRLQNLLSLEGNLGKQLEEKFTQIDDAYNKLGIVGKMVSIFSYNLVDPEMETNWTTIASLRRREDRCISKIFEGIDVLKLQLTKTIRKIADRTFNEYKISGTSSNSLAEFEEAYEKYGQLIKFCKDRHMQDTDQDRIERRHLSEARTNLVYDLLKNGILPRESWVSKREEFEGVLLDVITQDTRIESGFTDVRHNELLFAICERGQSDMFQFVCDHVSSKRLLEEFSMDYEGINKNPISAAIRHGHTSIVEIFAKKCPGFFIKENFNYGDMDRSMESVEILKIFAKTMSRADFRYMITLEGDGGRMHGCSALGWALTYDDREFLEIMEQVCPETVKEYREIY